MQVVRNLIFHVIAIVSFILMAIALILICLVSVPILLAGQIIAFAYIGAAGIINPRK